ncbi:rhomboid family intramembrane serine protease [Heyndrickxia sp. NPDC080065]|uniref:rhomboid family intramembrane serine protease n=1 Tax=Heyndrickxia sp. NPDC080065 TaxID=3390568 RepID=UPI003D068FA5
MFIRNESFSRYVRSYPIISTIILLQLLLYIMNFIPFIPYKFIFQSLAGVNLYIAEGEYWRLFTPIFLHSSFSHLLFNSLSLIIFGPFLERSLGKWIFCWSYLVSGFIANIATFMLLPLTYMHVGASGAIFGLFGIYLAMVLYNKRRMKRVNQQIIIPIIVIALVMTFFETNINVTAHIFGLITGLLLGLWYFSIRKSEY